MTGLEYAIYDALLVVQEVQAHDHRLVLKSLVLPESSRLALAIMVEKSGCDWHEWEDWLGANFKFVENSLENSVSVEFEEVMDYRSQRAQTLE